MDSIGKIVEEMRNCAEILHYSECPSDRARAYLNMRNAIGRLEALTKEPAAYRLIWKVGADTYSERLPDVTARNLSMLVKAIPLFSAPPAPVTREPDGCAYEYPYAFGGGTVISHNNGEEVNGHRPLRSIPYWYGTPPAPAAVSTQDLDDFLSRVQARVIELGHMPPAWPTNERDGTDDPVESAARMICGLLDAVKPAPAVSEGWRLVPKEPTLEMLVAGCSVIGMAQDVYSEWLAKHYRAMIAAAPEPEREGI